MSNTIEVEWLDMESECDICGWMYASGANVYLNGALILNLEPVAACYGGSDYSEAEVYRQIIEKLGYKVESQYV